MYGGGPLALSTGDRLVAQGVRLQSGYGGTEFGHPTLLWDRRPRASGAAADADWAWFRFVENVRFEPLGDGQSGISLSPHPGLALLARTVFISDP